MTLNIKTNIGEYPIYLKRGALQYASKLFSLNRKVLVVTDSGVPEVYPLTVASQCEEAVLFVFEQGENSKNMDTYAAILQTLTENAFSRTDCVVAVGGGVVGDMAGFAAATYMRGMDYYNIPTTVLAQIDSSIGGKTAIDFMGYKNLVGTFYPPKGVLIDPQVLQTLPARQVSNGLAEAVKVALTHDPELLLLLGREITDAVMDEIILRSIRIKQQVVQLDEHESGLRMVLNFGHTLGHAIESVTGLYHGECIAIGMRYMCSDTVQQQLIPLLEKLNLPTAVSCDVSRVIEAVSHDKKTSGESLTFVTVSEIGSFEFKTVPITELDGFVKESLS